MPTPFVCDRCGESNPDILLPCYKCGSMQARQNPVENPSQEEEISESNVYYRSTDSREESIKTNKGTVVGFARNVDRGSNFNKLHQAVLEGDAALVRTLIESGGNVDSTDINQDTPLFIAIRNGNRSITELLISSGASLKHINGNGQSPLHVAVLHDNFEMTKLLVENKAYIMSRNKKWLTPLHLAAAKGNSRIVDYFIREGALSTDAKARLYDSNIDESIRKKLLHYAALGGNEDIVRTFIRNQVKVNDLDTDTKETPLHVAAATGNIDAAKVLIENGAGVNAKDTGKNTPLHYAVSVEDIEMVRLLIESKSNLNRKNKNKDTPINIAKSTGSDEIVQLLIEYGANEKSRKKAGTPVYLRKKYVLETELLEDPKKELVDGPETEPEQEDDGWSMLVTNDSGTTYHYEREQILTDLKSNISNGYHEKNNKIVIYSKNRKGKWEQTDSTLDRFVSGHFKLQALYEPVWSYAKEGVKIGAIVGVLLKLLDTFIGLLAVDVEAAIFFGIALAICIIPIKNWIKFGAFAIFYFKFKPRANFFFMILGSALAGALLGCLPGMAIGGVVGHFRKKSLPLAKDANNESVGVYFKAILIPLIAGCALILLFVFFFMPWLVMEIF